MTSIQKRYSGKATIRIQNKVHVQHQRKATTSTNIKSWYELIY